MRLQARHKRLIRQRVAVESWPDRIARLAVNAALVISDGAEKQLASRDGISHLRQ